jgi:quinol monooxygenase YgiN
MSIKLAVQMQARIGKSEELVVIAEAAAARVRAEDAGCEQYELYRSLNDETRFVLLESWASAADLDAHQRSAATLEMRKIGSLLAGRPTMVRVET